MVGQTLDAVYENGVFRPLQPVDGDVKEGEKVRLRLLTVGAALRALEELTHIYDGLSEEEIKEIEKVILSRGNRSVTRHNAGQSKARKTP